MSQRQDDLKGWGFEVDSASGLVKDPLAGNFRAEHEGFITSVYLEKIFPSKLEYGDRHCVCSGDTAGGKTATAKAHLAKLRNIETRKGGPLVVEIKNRELINLFSDTSGNLAAIPFSWYEEFLIKQANKSLEEYYLQFQSYSNPLYEAHKNLWRDAEAKQYTTLDNFAGRFKSILNERINFVIDDAYKIGDKLVADYILEDSILKISNVKFSIFLSQECYNIVRSFPLVQAQTQTGLVFPDKIETWTEDLLVDLITKRLKFFIPKDSLVQDTIIQDMCTEPDWLSTLARKANKSPARLLELGDKLLDIHALQKNTDLNFPDKISRADLDKV